MIGEKDIGQVYIQDRAIYSINTAINGPVPIDDIITADGWNHTRHLITANGSMSGPSFISYQNQTITILVTNHMINEAVTIHWHGIDQLGWPAMDGVAFVSQCPILPGQTFNYTFQPTFGGSYWYHSHVGNQRDMGMYGAFIVLRKRDPVPFELQHIVQIQEWNHLYNAMDLLYANVKENVKYPNSILINGRGKLKNNLAPLDILHVTKGNRCLLRLIGVSSMYVLLFAIHGLKLNVTETDGFEVIPTVVDKIIIYPAERYDFELDLDYAKEGIYNITVSILSSPNLTITPPIELGFLNVSIKNNGQAKDIPKSNENALHFLNFGFPKHHSSINGRIFRWPTVSALTQPSEVDTNCNGCTDEEICHCSHSLNLKSGSTIIMVLLNLGTGAAISHPIHMHGHTNEVLKMEFPEVTIDGQFTFTDDIKCSNTLPNMNSSYNNARWRNSSWNDYNKIPGINTIDPLRKDTIVVPYGGYVIIRIEARNPGVWFMHCHIDKHMVEGMALMLNESFEHIQVPNGLPTCHSYLTKMSGELGATSSLQTSSTGKITLS
ncbi:iron transport multicopper oxidase [Mytilus galloprovincialis]|uniref:Iron transport multicopper oxidase n=1 Tax=Mytilus galloprovincialis TaxID=29158 RepID=A0A8B6CQD0_MYTGA|nr:iron transport multicopper oxidase [Mytilus galloprovincialis]